MDENLKRATEAVRNIVNRYKDMVVVGEVLENINSLDGYVNELEISIQKLKKDRETAQINFNISDAELKEVKKLVGVINSLGMAWQIPKPTI